MDPITHAALGAACSQGILGKYNRTIPWQVGALAAMAPDLDIFIRFKDDPLSGEFWHRFFTHSFIFIPIGGLLVALFCMCIPLYRKHSKITIAAALIGYATHGVLDALTSYGTVLLWPFSSMRISWDLIAIVDPLFTIVLILGTAWSVVLREQKGILIGLICAGAMLLFNGLYHYKAMEGIQTFAQQRQLNLKAIRAMPDLASSTHWRGIAKNKNCLLIFDIYTPLFIKSSLYAIAKFPLFSMSEKVLSKEQKQDLNTFLWFSDEYAIRASLEPYTLADGRYTLGINPIYSLWGIEFLPNKNHATEIKYILLNEPCSY